MSPDNIINGVINFPLAYYLIHKLVVAVKYASLSESEYKRFQSSKSPYCQKYRRQMELVSGWLRRDSLVLDFAMSAAIAGVGLKPSCRLRARIGPPLASLTKLPENMKLWFKFLGIEEIFDLKAHLIKGSSNRGSSIGSSSNVFQDKDGTYVPLFDLCVAIVRRTDEQEFFFNKVDKACIILACKNIDN